MRRMTAQSMSQNPDNQQKAVAQVISDLVCCEDEIIFSIFVGVASRWPASATDPLHPPLSQALVHQWLKRRWGCTVRDLWNLMDHADLPGTAAANQESKRFERKWYFEVGGYFQVWETKARLNWSRISSKVSGGWSLYHQTSSSQWNLCLVQ